MEHRYCCNNGECDGHNDTVADSSPALDVPPAPRPGALEATLRHAARRLESGTVGPIELENIVWTLRRASSVAAEHGL